MSKRKKGKKQRQQTINNQETKKLPLDRII